MVEYFSSSIKLYLSCVDIQLYHEWKLKKKHQIFLQTVEEMVHHHHDAIVKLTYW